MIDEGALARLIDLEAIRTCLATYSRAVDRLDRDLLLSVYHPDAIDDHGAFVGSPDAFADWAMGLHRRSHVSHQHCQFNSMIDLDGDVAHAETYYMFVGMNRAGEPLSMTGGRYIDRLDKRDGRWAIAVRVCLRDWAPLKQVPQVLDQSAMTVAVLDDTTRAMMREGAQPARDRSDASYMRPLTIDPQRLAKYRS